MADNKQSFWTIQTIDAESEKGTAEFIIDYARQQLNVNSSQKKTEEMVKPKEQNSQKEEITSNNIRSLIFEELKKDFVEKYGVGRRTKPIQYAGGDWYIRNEILPIIRQSGATKLVEVFGGSGVITQFAPREQFKIIVYNDKDSLLTNFFLVLRDRTEELVEKLFFMPNSRELFNKYKNMLETGEIYKLDPMSKAIATFYLLNTSFSGTTNGWSIRHRGNSSVRMRHRILALADYAKRWLDVDIENKDFREVLKIHDSSNTVFYLDPPYLPVNSKERKGYYRVPFTERDMRELLEMLSRIKGKFVLKLPKDHLEIPYIKEWIQKHGYYVTPISHKLIMQKRKDGQKRDVFTTVLIHNFPTSNLIE
jgi:DNA adenine methylase